MDATQAAMAEFFSECDEILGRFSAKLSETESIGRVDSDTTGSLYRDMHTLKGTAQLFGFKLFSQVAHAIEASLEPIRTHHLQIPARLMDALFDAVGLLDRILKDSVKEGREVAKGVEDEAINLVARLMDSILSDLGGDLEPWPDRWLTLDEDKVPGESSPHFQQALEEPRAQVAGEFSQEVSKDQPSSELEVQTTHQVGVPLNSDRVTRGEIMEAGSAATEKNTEKSPTKEPKGVAPSPKEAPAKEAVSREAGEGGGEASSTVRINVGLLDKLMNLVGEMVLVRNQMLQYGQKHSVLEFLNLSQRLDVVTTELQGDVMKTRMQPIGSVLAKFTRLVRDLSKDLGKQIEFIVQGADTELDKTLLEAIKDPLTHIIRNCCDHGLELPDVRVKAGKKPQGRVHVRAFHEGGHVIIEISDDGKGLSLKRIGEKALEKKLLSAEELSKLSEREVAALIFAPGFSTAEKITSVSGRGVGMDVVKTNLEKIGGQVELQSEEGKGMQVRLKIPLTLAIVPALIIRAAGENFAIPQLKLAELVRVERDGNGPKIELHHGKPVFRLRGQLLSIVRLSEVLGVQDPKNNFLKQDWVNIVVLNGENETFGLIVDEIRDTADIVVKPLSAFLKKLQIYSGATIMGDGSISLILDVTGLAQKCHLFRKPGRREFVADSKGGLDGRVMNQDVQDYLFFRLNSKESYCLPLCLVNRLEEFPASEVSRSGLQRIVKYRGSILPILSMNDFFKFPEPEKRARENSVSLIVIEKNNRHYGIEVNSVVDIASVRGAIEEPVKETRGVLGSVIVDKEIATVIDVYAILDILTEGATVKLVSSQAGRGEVRSAEGASAVAVSATRPLPGSRGHVLFAEDTVFFVKQVKKVLEAQGFRVTHAENGQVALDLLLASKPGDFQFILSDIEMPKLTGFELAARVREDERFSQIPMIALTTRFREVDQEKGMQAGFNRYLEKLKSDELIVAIQDLLKEGGPHVSSRSG